MLLRNINVVKRGKNNRNFDVGVKTILNNFSLDKYWPFITIKRISQLKFFYLLYHIVGLKSDSKLLQNDVHSITLILCLFFVSALVTSCYLCYCFYYGDDSDDLQCPITHHKGDRFDIQVHFHSI